MPGLEQEVAALLRSRGLSLGLVESASGGLISHLITNVPGSSDYYNGSITAYSNQVKTSLVGVKEATLNRYGAVSPQVAQEMAGGGRIALTADVCLANTGIAGPGGATDEKPVGLFYIGLAHRAGASSRKFVFSGDREENKKSTARAGLSWLKEYLESL